MTRHVCPYLTAFGALIVVTALAACDGEGQPDARADGGDDDTDADGDRTRDDTGLDAEIDTGDGDGDTLPIADWVVVLDPSAEGENLTPALLGHYDLSGALYRYNEVPGLVEAMAAAGFAEWRIGLGRWEAGTLVLPELTDGTPCPFPIEQGRAPPGWTDLDLIAARDWFVDDGLPVTVDATLIDSRYALSYVRSVVDVAEEFGVRPYVSIDLMPRALAAARDPIREPLDGLIGDPCSWSFSNQVSNHAPVDPAVFAAAVVGLVQRVVEGSGVERGRRVAYWELWNEPELVNFWFPPFADSSDSFFEMIVATLVGLSEYRTTSTLEWADSLRFGIASFANAETAIAIVEAFDAIDIPGLGHPPLDFVSFHAYYDDPLEVVARIEAVAAILMASDHYRDAEMVLAEWGPDLSRLGDSEYNESLLPSLMVATVVVLGAAVGLDRTHHTFFWDYFPVGLVGGLLDHELRPRPLYYTYQLMSELLGDGARQLPPVGAESGRLDGGSAAVLAVADDETGALRAIFVNRGDTSRTARIDVAGVPATPRRLRVLDVPGEPHDGVLEGRVFVVPPQSILLVEL